MKNTPRPRRTKQQILRMHLRGVERMIRGYIVPQGTYKLLEKLYEFKINEDEQK